MNYRLTALAAAAALLTVATPALAQNDLPTCTVKLGNAYVAHYGPGADSVCNSIDASTQQIIYGGRPHGTIACTLASMPDIPSAFTSGHAVVVFDNALQDPDTATNLCSYYALHPDGYTVVDQNWEPYQP